MKSRDFSRWLLTVLVFWIPVSLAVLLGVLGANNDRLRVQAMFLHEGMKFDLEKIQRARQSEFLLSLPWAEIRSSMKNSLEPEQWRQEAIQGLTTAGIAPERLLVWSSLGDRIFPENDESEDFRKFLKFLRERRNQELEDQKTNISFSGSSLPVHLAQRMTRRHRLYPMQILGRKLWLAHGPISGRGSNTAYYLLLIDQAGISSQVLFPLWRKRLQRYLNHPLSEHPNPQNNEISNRFSDEPIFGERFFSWDSNQAVAGIRFPDRDLHLRQTFSISARIWAMLAFTAWAAFSFAWLLGSYRVWVSGFDERLLSLRMRIHTHLGAAVGIPLIGIILMGEVQMNSQIFANFHAEQDEMSIEIERTEDKLDRQLLRLERKMKKVADTLPAIFSREEAEYWCFEVLEGSYHLSNAHLFASSGVYLLPIHQQNKPGFQYVTLFPRARRDWFLHRFFERSGYLEAYYQNFLEMYQEDGKPLSPQKLKHLIRTTDRSRPVVSSKDGVWERAIGGLAQDTCKKSNQRAGLLEENGNGGTKSDTFGMMAAVAGLEHEDLVNESMEQMGRIQKFNTAKETFFDMVYLIRDKSGRAQNLLLLHWRNEALTFPFAHAMARQAKLNKKRGGLYFFCDDHDALDFASTPVPKGVRFTASALDRPGDSNRYMCRMSDGEWRLFQFRRCRDLDHLIVGISRPADQILASLNTSRLQFAAGFSVLTGVVALLLLVLSRFLIQPLEGVEKAVARLSRPGEPFPEISKPVGEVLNLIRLLAEVKTGLKQLDVARLVQEDLLPHGILVHRRLRVTGKSQMMEQVGGDFFDMVVDPRDARFLYVGIGDVTGHGLSAAIVVAMISSAVRLLSRTARVSPEAFLTAMNPHLARILKRVRMTSFQITRINADTGEFQFASGGHPPLLQMKPDRAPVSWEIPAFPLGSKKSTRYLGQAGRLEPGEGFIFSTDGCVEATTPSGKEVGYPGFACLASYEFNAGFEGIIPRLFDRFEQTTGTTSWNDDVTMVALIFDPVDKSADAERAGEISPAKDNHSGIAHLTPGSEGGRQ